MDGLMKFLSAGALKGHRTKILGAVIAIEAIATYLVGDINLAEFLDQLPQIAIGLGIITMRDAIPDSEE